MRSRMRVNSVAVLILSIGIGGCATLVGGGSSQAVQLTSAPTGARFVVKSSSGLQMASGAAPQSVRLPRKNEYQIEFTVPGYQTQSVSLSRGTNGWIWGNLVFGWVVGFIVDFATGSAYKLEPAIVEVTLVQQLNDSGYLEPYGVVRLLDRQGRVVAEESVKLVPIR